MKGLCSIVLGILCLALAGGFFSTPVSAGFAGSLPDPVSSMQINAGWLYGRGSVSDAHHGIDILGAEGTAIKSVASGTVILSKALLSTSTSDGYATGSLQSAGSNYAQLPSTFSATDDAYNGYILQMKTGSAAWHSRKITDYVGASKTAYLEAVWTVMPAAGNSFEMSKVYVSYGEHIIVQHSTYWTVYAHLRKRLVFSGATVSAGTQLGEMGKTGNVTGVHLHFEIRKGSNLYNYVRNPECWLARSTGTLRGAVRGLVVDSSSKLVLRGVTIAGAAKPDDYNYTYTYTYGLRYDGQPYQDEPEYGINYYIGRATSGSVILTYSLTGYNSYYYSTTVTAGQDIKLLEIWMVKK